MKTPSRIQGFTLVEMLVAVAILVIITTLSIEPFKNFRKNQALDKSATQVVSLLQKARSQTLAQRNSSAYGVRFLADQAIMYQNTYATSTLNTAVIIDPYVEISSVNLTGGALQILFVKFTGEVNATGTVTLRLKDEVTRTKTVTIHSTGIVE